MAVHLEKPRSTTGPEIPDKLYFRIGEVARLCRVPAYVLRFWESEFPQLKPNKSGTGQRLYRRRDVELALRIKQLVHEEGYTIAGARSVLQEGHRRRAQPAELPLPASATGRPLEEVAAGLNRIRVELREVLGMLSGQLPAPVKPRPRATREPFKGPTLFDE
jgi:DNA-binding transcriptional MerR regulator